MKITVKQLEALRAPDAGTFVREPGGIAGRVRVTKAGSIAVSFNFEFKREGKKGILSIGTWPRDLLSNIRKARDEARVLLDSGIDPRDARKADELEKQAEVETRIEEAHALLSRPTFERRFDEWERAALSKRKDKGAETRRAFVKDVFPALGTKALPDVTRADLMALLDSIVARGAARLANRTLGDLKQFLTWCVDREIIVANPLATITKAKVGGREEESDRVLSEKELRALPVALDNANLLDTTKHAVMVVLGTAVRIGELLRARKAHIDLDAGEWVIPSSSAKNTDAHRVFLSGFAAYHLSRLMKLSKSEEWLMPARKRDGTESHVDLKSVTKQISDRQLRFFEREAHSKRSVEYANSLVLVADADESWSPHDLRRTAATLLQELGVLPVVVDKVLNHREQGRVRRTYQRYSYEGEKREAWRLLGERLELLLNSQVSNVATFPPRSARAEQQRH